MQAFFVPRERTKCFQLCSLDRVYPIDSHDSLTLPTCRGARKKPVPFLLGGVTRHWLVAPQWALKDQRPVDCLLTEVESRVVLELIGQIRHGIAI